MRKATILSYMNKSDAEWKNNYPEQYSVLREKKRPRHRLRVILSITKKMACIPALAVGRHYLRASTSSKQVWLAKFYDVANTDSVRLVEDRSHGMQRIEVLCKSCMMAT